MKYVIEYHETVIKREIPKLNGSWKNKIKNALEVKLTTEPILYGKPLRGSLAGLYKLRVGSYRVIYRIEKNNIVFVVYIQHRSTVYKHQEIEKRTSE